MMGPPLTRRCIKCNRVARNGSKHRCNPSNPIDRYEEAARARLAATVRHLTREEIEREYAGRVKP